MTKIAYYKNNKKKVPLRKFRASVPIEIHNMIASRLNNNNNNKKYDHHLQGWI